MKVFREEKENLKVMICGLGTMGLGLSRIFFRAGAELFLVTRTPSKVDQFRNEMKQYYSKKRRLQNLGGGEKLESLLATIHLVNLESPSCSPDIIIESVCEDFSVKVDTLQRIKNSHAAKQSIIATITSSTSINQLAEKLEKDARVIGLHFFNPVTLIELVEVEKSKYTDNQILKQALSICRQLNKTPILVKDSPGFLVNRCFNRFLSEGCRLYMNGQKEINEIEADTSEGIFRFGGFQIADFIGLDVVYAVGKEIETHYGHFDTEDKFYVLPVLKAILQTGALGIKTKKGFYLYENRTKPKNNPFTSQFRSRCGDHQKEKIYDPKIPLYALINEAILCWEEGIIAKEDIDTAFKLSLGMFKGPMELLNQIGVSNFANILTNLQLSIGQRFKPARFLRIKQNDL